MKDLPKRATVAEIAKIIARSEKVVRECINAAGAKKGKDKYGSADHDPNTVSCKSHKERNPDVRPNT